MFILRRLLNSAWWAAAVGCFVGVFASTAPHACGPRDTYRDRTSTAVSTAVSTTTTPVVLVFDTPVNGSTVQGPSLELTYTLNTARGAGGRRLTTAEVNILRKRGVSMCFYIDDANAGPPTCSPLAVEVIGMYRMVPGIWWTLTATLSDGVTTTAVDDGLVPATIQETRRDSSVRKDTAWQGSGDTVTVWVGLDNPSLLADSLCGESACLDNSDLRSAYFDSIYSGRLWDLAGSRSGIGSEVTAALEIRLALEQVISSYGITSMLDAPCGDLTWMPLVRGIDQVRYTGADISTKIVVENREKFPAEESTGRGHGLEGAQGAKVAGRGAGFRNAVFVQADLVDAVPLSADGGSYDIIFVRDLMIHLPPRHNLKILQNIQASGARLFMATTFLDGDENLIADTFKPAAGHFINLALPPYCLRPPDALFKDFTGVKHDKRMGLWELDSGRPLIGGSGEHYCGHVTWR